MKLGTFSFYTILGTALWSLLLSWSGRLLGEQWPLIADFINTYQNIVLVITAILVVGFIVSRLISKRKVKKN
jgi:membrane protein DedA with SNARE-associated domain